MGLLKSIQFQDCYQKHFQQIYNYVYFRLGQNRHLAEDLTQDIFIQALEHFDSFDERVPFTVWIYKIAKNKIIDTYRKKKINQQSLESVDNTEVASKSADEDFVLELEHQGKMEEVRKAIDKLPNSFQEIITLKYLNDLTTEEICDILGCDSNYVRVNLHRAHQKLIQLLKGHERK